MGEFLSVCGEGGEKCADLVVYREQTNSKR